MNTPALRALVAAFEPGRFRPPAPTTPASPGDIEALVCRPNWALIDAVEAHLPRRPTALDILYERSQAAKKDAIRGLTFLAALAVFLQLMT